MATEPVINVDELLEPISEEAPCGSDVREDPSPTSVYQQLKDARREARDRERQLEASDEADAEPADWRPVQTHGIETLRSHTKDLEVAAWTIEALVRRERFAGLRDGFRLIRGLVETFWDDLYPPEEDEGVVDKVAPLAGLNGEDADGLLIAPIRRLPLTEMGSFGELAWYHYLQASDLDMVEDEERLEQLKEAGHVTLEQFQVAAMESGAGFYRTLIDDLKGAIDEFAALNEALAERCGDEAPPSSQIRNALQESLETVLKISAKVLPPEEPEEEEDEALEGEDGGEGDGEEGASGGGSRQKAMAIGEVRSRAEAFRALGKIAEFFRKTEPHSPISYALEQAVRWGDMELPDLMKELINDDTTRQQFFSLTGIKQEQDDGY